MTEAMGWRSLLFVPGARPDRFDKALASGADAVCVDLEDAVAPARKDEARAAAIRFLVDGAGQGGPDRVVRINSVRSLAGLRDLLAIAEARPAGGTVAVPKLESAEEVQWIDQVLAEAGVPVRLVAQIETLRGVEQASAIAAASSRLAALMFGGLDLAAELGVPASWDALLLARSRTVHAAARAGLAAIDMPFVDVAAPEGCRAEAVRSLGLGGSVSSCAKTGNLARSSRLPARSVMRRRACRAEQRLSGHGSPVASRLERTGCAGLPGAGNCAPHHGLGRSGRH